MPAKPTREPKYIEAARWLREYLSTRPEGAARGEIQAAANEQGISYHTLTRAAEHLNVTRTFRRSSATRPGLIWSLREER